MPWLIVNARDRGLLVKGAQAGAVAYTRDVGEALCFDRQDDARRWIAREVVAGFGALALLREPQKRNPAQAGRLGGAMSSTSQEEISDEHSAIPTGQTQA